RALARAGAGPHGDGDRARVQPSRRRPARHCRPAGTAPDGEVMSALLQVEELRLAVGRRELIHGVSFSLSAGAVTGLIGESGSGKTLTALSVIRARNLRQVRIAGGSIRLEG